jgi:hypothetical protein
MYSPDYTTELDVVDLVVVIGSGWAMNFGPSRAADTFQDHMNAHKTYVLVLRSRIDVNHPWQSMMMLWYSFLMMDTLYGALNE